MKLVTFQLSDEIFWGYKIVIDIDMFTSSHDIIEIVKDDMKQFFKSHNLLNLAERIDGLSLCMPCLQNLKNKINITEQIVYICSHEHSCPCCKNNY